MDRSIAPEIKEIDKILLRNPDVYPLSNQTTLYHMPAMGNQTARVDFVFDAGSRKAEGVIASLTSGMLFTGTETKNSHQIHEEIDVLGGYFGVETTVEFTTVSIIGLKEHIVELTTILIAAMHEVVFDPTELEQLLQSRKKKLEINLEKVSTMARHQFMQLIFPNSPYGYVVQLDDFKHVNREELIRFHKNHFLSGLLHVAMVGDFDSPQIEAIKKQALRFKSAPNEIKQNHNFHYKPQVIHLEKENAVQTAIRVGRILFNKNHEDFQSFSVLNTVLGGYFGSRLMSSLREDKGYTYGVGSGVIQNVMTGCFFISTEVNKSVKEDAIQTIQKEIKRLQETCISEEELQLVKNYSIGNLLENADGPQAVMDRFFNVHHFDLTIDYYNNLIATIRHITPKEIQLLAKKYLQWEDMVVVTAG